MKRHIQEEDMKIFSNIKIRDDRLHVVTLNRLHMVTINRLHTVRHQVIIRLNSEKLTVLKHSLFILRFLSTVYTF